MSGPESLISRELEKVVGRRLVAQLVEVPGRPLLSRLDGLRLTSGNQELRIAAGGEVEDELAP